MRHILMYQTDDISKELYLNYLASARDWGDLVPQLDVLMKYFVSCDESFSSASLRGSGVHMLQYAKHGLWLNMPLPIGCNHKLVVHILRDVTDVHQLGRSYPVLYYTMGNHVDSSLTTLYLNNSAIYHQIHADVALFL